MKPSVQRFVDAWCDILPDAAHFEFCYKVFLEDKLDNESLAQAKMQYFIWLEKWLNDVGHKNPPWSVMSQAIASYQLLDVLSLIPEEDRV